MQLCDRLQKLNTTKPHLWYPQCTNNVGPSAIICPLNGTATNWTHTASDVVGNTRLTSSTQPLSLGDVRYAIAVLVNGKVARITEQDRVDIRTLVITAYSTNGIVV